MPPTAAEQHRMADELCPRVQQIGEEIDALQRRAVEEL